ncbi:MAG: PAS domain-containing protein [Candidatus Eisenbacteria bacterium]|nr:PAS domain-containing protein [Candidatus Eisenbacteria bacterium]
MTVERRTGLAARIVGIVILEYAIVVVGCLTAIRRFGPSAGEAASIGAVLFGVLSLINFLVARRLFRGGPATGTPMRRDESEDYARLREEFYYLRWYLDELVENWNTAVLVLDRSLLVRSMNRAGRDLLSLREKAELVGRPFHLHPLSAATYRGQVSCFRDRPLREALAACCREGTPVLLEKIAYHRMGGEEPVLLDVLVTPWGERVGEPHRLVLRLERTARNGGIVAREGAGPAEPLPLLPRETEGPLREACADLKGRIEALHRSCRSIAEAVAPSRNGVEAELLLFEIQADRIREEMDRLESLASTRPFRARSQAEKASRPRRNRRGKDVAES